MRFPSWPVCVCVHVFVPRGTRPVGNHPQQLIPAYGLESLKAALVLAEYWITSGYLD